MTTSLRITDAQEGDDELLERISACRSSRPSRTRHRVIKAILALVFTLLGTGVATLSMTDPAMAIPGFSTNDLCGRRDFPTPDAAGQGVDSLVPPPGTGSAAPYQLPVGPPNGYTESGQEGRVPVASQQMPVPWYAQFGMAGTTWNVYNIGCLDTDRLFLNPLADTVFTTAKALDRITISLFQWAFTNELVKDLTEPRTDRSGVVHPSPVDRVVSSLGVRIFYEFLLPAVMVGALVVGVRVIVQRRGGADALGRVIWIICAAAFGMWFISNASWAVRKLDSASHAVTETALVALSGSDCEDQRNPANCVAQSFYTVLVYQPWVSGTLGRSDLTDPDAQAYGPRVVYQQAFTYENQTWLASNPDGRKCNTSWLEALLGEMARGQRVPWWQMNDQALEDLQRQEEEAMRKEMPGNGAACLWKHADRDAMLKADWGVNNNHKDNPQVSKKPDLYEAYTGNGGGRRLLVSVSAAMAAVGVGVLLSFGAVSYLMFTIGLLMFTMMAPPFLLIGCVPGRGRQIGLRYLELYVGCATKQVGVGMGLGGAVALHGAVLSASGLPWFMQIVIVVVISGVSIAYRTTVMDMFSPSFGGGNAIPEQKGIGGQILGKVGAAGMMYTNALTGGLVGAHGAGGGIKQRTAGFVRGAVGGAAPFSLQRAQGAGSRAGYHVRREAIDQALKKLDAGGFGQDYQAAQQKDIDSRDKGRRLRADLAEAKASGDTDTVERLKEEQTEHAAEVARGQVDLADARSAYDEARQRALLRAAGKRGTKKIFTPKRDGASSPTPTAGAPAAPSLPQSGPTLPPRPPVPTTPPRPSVPPRPAQPPPRRGVRLQRQPPRQGPSALFRPPNPPAPPPPPPPQGPPARPAPPAPDQGGNNP